MPIVFRDWARVGVFADMRSMCRRWMVIRSPPFGEQGCYAPTEFADATSEAFATIDVGTMAEYEMYRARLAAHPKQQENVRKVEGSGAIHSIHRPIIKHVERGAAAQ